MKRLFKNSVIVILLFGTAIYFPSCKKEATLPVVITTNVSEITQTTALTGGTVTDDGGAGVTDFGICWSTTPNPTISSTKTSNGKGTGSFNSSITGLTPNTTYYVRAYATNSVGTAYGKEILFTTNEIIVTPGVPTLFTIFVSSITSITAVSGGEVTDDNGGDIIALGVCWSTAHSPTITDSRTTDLIGSGPFTSNISGLTPNTTYFVRAYATNNLGTAYGNEVTFTTPLTEPLGQKADFPGGRRYDAAGFSIGTKVYMGLGYDGTNYSDAGDNPRNDFWEWDQATNVWAKKADFPGSITGNFVCFSIGTKGYIGTGNHISTNSSTYDFWEYDPATNTWTQKASLPTTPARGLAVGFSIGTKGYIGIGAKYGSDSDPYYKDFWEWDQATNVWTQKADFAGNARSGAVGFSIGNKGYIGTGAGSDGINYGKEFWEWDQATNVWTQKANFGGKSRGWAVGFSIGNKGYIGTGYDGFNYTKDFWEWDQSANIWTKKADFNGDARALAVGFSIGNKVYIGTGSGSIINAFKDFWEYDPALK
jgi:N-acetylneuraminic acid mutarotase